MQTRPVLSRAARFARALALVTGGASASCSGGEKSAEPPPHQEADAATTETALADVGAPETGSSANALSCIEAEEQATCKPGQTCHVDTSYGFLICDVPETGVNKPCGAISCGWLCACSDPVASTCECYGGAGPLPPPDLAC